MSEATHTELCKALKVSSFRDRKLCLIVSRLGMTCLGVCRVGLLLKLVDPQVGRIKLNLGAMSPMPA